MKSHLFLSPLFIAFFAVHLFAQSSISPQELFQHDSCEIQDEQLKSALVCNIDFSKSEVCGATSITALGDFTNFFWNTGATTQTITVTNSGTYTVTATNQNIPCSVTASINVTVMQNFPVSITGNFTICTGDSTQLTALPAGATYQWSGGWTTQSIAVSPIFSTKYDVTVTGQNGCTGTASTPWLVVNPVPLMPIIIPTITDQNVVLTSSAPNNLWSTGGTGSSITVTNSGIFSTTTTNPVGCKSTSLMPVFFKNCDSIQPTPTDYIFAETGNWNPIGTGATICVGDTVVLTVTQGTAQTATYLWSPWGTKYKFHTFIATQPGIFPVICQVTTPGNWPNPDVITSYNFTLEVLGCPTPTPVNEPGEEKIGISVVPNPATDYVTLNFTDPALSAENVSIFNSLGEQLASFGARKSGEEIDLQDLPSGVYFLQITIGGEVYIRQLVK